MSLIFIVLSNMLLAVLAPPLIRLTRQKAAGWLALLPASQAVFFLFQAGTAQQGAALRADLPWVPSLGVEFSFALDGLSMLFALLISGIGACVVWYASAYLAGNPLLGRFYLYLFLFMGAMLGIVLSDNLFTLFVFWELTSITSYLLIGFENEKESARAAALQALLVTASGGLALLGGLVLLGQIAGTTEISKLNLQGEALRTSGLYLPALLLILTGAFTKSAQFPFHFWLPGAMQAPTPVSAYLHSATMVKAGVYLLARLTPALGGSAWWQGVVTTVGLLTFLTGAALAIGQTDLKRLLAYSTVASLGTMTMLLGIGTPLAVKAAVVYLLAHALYKGALFLTAGAVDHETGSRDICRLSGLRKAMPKTALAAGLALVSMAGLPPALGFLAKELLYETTLAAPGWTVGLTAAALLANASLAAIAALVALRPFFGQIGNYSRPVHEAPGAMWAGPLSMSVLGLLAGVLPGNLATPLVAPAVTNILQKETAIYLPLWHGINPMLALSALTLAIGTLLFVFYRPVWAFARQAYRKIRIGPARGYELALVALKKVAAAQTRLLQNGYLRFYLMTIILATVGLAGVTMLRAGIHLPPVSVANVRVYEMVLVGITLIAVTLVTRVRSRLTAVALLGITGYSIALIYLLYGALDLAMIQFAIETLTVILFVLVVYRLPKFTRLTSPPARLWDALVALSGGGLMAALALIVNAQPMTPYVSKFFIENSLTPAYGRNVVNVILVDFRGLDTLGEITVLALAAIGVFALIRLTLGKIELYFEQEEEEG